MSKVTKYLVEALPLSPPKWWPRGAGRKALWVGVLKEGDGWIVGDGDSMTAAQAQEAVENFEPSSRFRRREIESKKGKAK